MGITFALLPALRRNALALKRENLPWFALSGVFVAAAQGFLYSALAVAPIMLVAPVMQLGLVFRLDFALWLTRDHEVFGWAVVIGTVVSNASINDEYKHVVLKVHPHALRTYAGQMFHLLCPSPDGAEVWMRRPMSVYRVDKANGQIEFLLRESLARAGRLSKTAGKPRGGRGTQGE